MTIMTLEDELTSAAATGDTQRVELLLRSGADVNGVNRFGQTPLQVMMMGSVSVALALLERGADPNATDALTGLTPLHDAARLGFLDTVRALVRFGADHRALDRRRRRPVDLARASGHGGVVEFLQALGP